MNHVKPFDIVDEAINYQSTEMNQLKDALDIVLNSNQATKDELKEYVIGYLDSKSAGNNHPVPSNFDYNYKNG